MRFSHIFVPTIFTAIGIASPADIDSQRQYYHEVNHVLHERRDTSAPWQRRNALSDDAVLPMRIGLRQSNLNRAYEMLMEISDPDSKQYGQYYTVEQVHDLFAPSEESYHAVRRWIEDAGVETDRISRSLNKQWIQLDLHVREAEHLLQTKYHFYEHLDSGKPGLGCDEYHVHKDVRQHIDYVTPGVKVMGAIQSLPSHRKARGLGRRAEANITDNVVANDLSHCSNSQTPQCMMAMYNITAATSAQPRNELGIFQTAANYIDSLDLNSFFTRFYPKIPNGTFPIIKGVDGGINKNNPSYPFDEGSMDLTISYPIIYPQNSIVFSVDDPYYQTHSTKLGLNNFLDAIDGSYCNYSAYGITGNSPSIDNTYPDPHTNGYKGQLQCGVYKPPNVISISYATGETGQGLPHNYERRQCIEYLKLGLQGISVVFSSGDNGVGSNDVCAPPKNDPSASSIPCHRGCLGKDRTVFSPMFPASCPYITSVGSTRLPAAESAAKDEEVASDDIASGGGFSNVFAVPVYQKSAVEAYFKSAAAPTYPYFPDVSAIGQDVKTYVGGLEETVSGTSLSVPLFAAILNRINDERLAVGKGTIGFVNPTLYKHPYALHDITSGSNSNCGSNGYSAGQGWDPVSGLGTPNYPALRDVFMNLP